MKKNSNLLLKLILLATIFSIFVANKVMEKSFAIEEQNVVLGITPKPKIDIVLAKSRTKTEITDFKTNIMDALRNVDVDPSDVKVTAVKAQTVNMETSFQWQKDISSSIGSIAIANNGQNVIMKGNQTNPGKNAIWIMPIGNQEQKFNFGYNIDFGDSFNAAGMLLRVKQEGNVLSGYMLSFNKSGQNWYTVAGNKNGAIWKFTYNIGTNTTNMTKTLVQGLNINTSGTLNVTATDSEIVINGGGMSSSVTYEIPEDEQTIGNGFGFFSDHYSHNCTNIGSFTLTNINLETTVVRSFNEVLREPDWRQGAYKFLVNVDDTENEELKNVSAYSELLTRLLNENIYFVSWGKDKNQSQFSDLVEANNGNGKFISNTDYDTSINETAAYIESIVGNQKLTQTVIVDEPISLSVNPPGIDKNTIDSEWPYGKWEIEHDYTYFENNIGQFAESGKYINNLITTFDKTGRYVIKYKEQSIYPQEIFVHRRPIAQIGMQISGTSITLNSQSYDKDKISQNNGIEEEEWKWKDSSSTVWNNGKLTTMDTDKTYIVQLRVKDFQNTWSIPATKYITKDTRALPVAMYDIPNDNITKYEEVEINNISYDPVGREIISSLWEVYKDGNKIYSGTTPKINYLDEGVGTYTMYLTVTNSDNIISEKYGRTFKIVEDTMAPEVVATPVTASWAKRTTVHVKFTDEGGSLVRGYKYAITDSQAIPTTWSAEIAKSEDDIVIHTEGRKYLHIIAYDNANNVSNDRILGPYLIDNSGPTIQVEGDFNTVTTQGVICNIRAVDLLSGLKTVSVNNETLTDLGNSVIKINKNGTYVIKAEDNIGNISTKEFIINNIHNRCEAGLEHPTYSSSYKECPICKLIENLQVTKNKEIYNAQEKGLTYDKSQGTTIVEYYNGSTQKPVDVGKYEYDLKVVYEGVEYNTGIMGTFEITKKVATIENIMAQNRQYDGTNQVALTGGNLIGIEGADKVGFTLPLLGTISNKDIGEYNVTIPDIILTGEKAHNYELVQPSKDSLKATISPRELTITELQAVSRPYNKKAEIEIMGGKLNNLIEENTDSIGFILNGGVAKSNAAGEQIVDINAIELTNNEKENYVLISPEPIKVQITKKEITVEDMTAQNRQYDGTDKVVLTGGKLIGIEEGDQVETVLPEIGIISSKNIGEYNVTVPEIILTGEKATNYQLIQPAKEAMKVTITKRELTIDNLKTKDRKYDKTNVVELEGGELQNIVGKEEVIAIIPKTGIIPDADIGTRKVEIEPIELEGKDSANYVLIQPKSEEMLVKISKPDKPNLQLETFISQVNDSKLKEWEPTVTIANTDKKETDETKAKMKEETEEETSVEMKEKANEKPDEKTKEKANEKTDKETKEEANENTTEETNQEINPEKNKYPEIRFGDRVEITIRIYNKGEGNGYAQKITNVIPKGMKFVAEDKTNQENKWKQIDTETVVSEKLNFASGIENEIEKLNEKEIDYRDISLVLEVIEKEAVVEMIQNKTTIEQIDIREEKIEYEKEENKTILPIRISHTDFVVEKTIQDIIEITAAGQINHQVPQNNNKLSKIEIDRKNINATQLKITYNITITNHGNAKGKVDAVIDYLPNGLQCDLSDNLGWTFAKDNRLICESFGELEPDETKTKELVVYGKAAKITGSKENKVVVLSSQDIDQRMIEQKNKKSLIISNVDKEIFNTNNSSNATLLTSIRTGIVVNYLVGLIVVCLTLGVIIRYFRYKR